MRQGHRLAQTPSASHARVRAVALAAAGVEGPVVLGKQGRRYRRRIRCPGGNTREVNQRSTAYRSTCPGVSGTARPYPLRNRTRVTPSCTRRAVPSGARSSSITFQSVSRASLAAQRGRHRPGDLEWPRERRRGEGQHVRPRPFERGLQLARVDRVRGRQAGSRRHLFSPMTNSVAIGSRSAPLSRPSNPRADQRRGLEHRDAG